MSNYFSPYFSVRHKMNCLLFPFPSFPPPQGKRVELGGEWAGKGQREKERENSSRCHAQGGAPGRPPSHNPEILTPAQIKSLRLSPARCPKMNCFLKSSAKLFNHLLEYWTFVGYHPNILVPFSHEQHPGGMHLWSLLSSTAWVELTIQLQKWWGTWVA